MPFTAAILDDAADYDSVRDVLNLSDTVLTDAKVDQPMFLPVTEALVKQRVTTWATILADTDSDNYYRLKGATALLCAARLARLWLAPRQGEEVTREQVGADSWAYRTGPEWEQLASRLADQALSELAQLEQGPSAAAAPILTAGVQAGPYHSRRIAQSPRTDAEWLTYTLAPIIDPDSIE